VVRYFRVRATSVSRALGVAALTGASHPPGERKPTVKLTLKHALAAIVLILSFAAPVAAGRISDAFSAMPAGPISKTFADALIAEVNGDYPTALRLFRSLADQGTARAQNELGGMYADGKGVPRDYAEAVKWYRLAADQGDALAQFALGTMYGNGQGMPQGYVRAHMWLNLSAAAGNQKAKKNRDDVAQRMTPAQIAEAQKLVREWKPATQAAR
jgi:hypothetical protein